MIKSKAEFGVVFLLFVSVAVFSCHAFSKLQHGNLLYSPLKRPLGYPNSILVYNHRFQQYSHNRSTKLHMNFFKKVLKNFNPRPPNKLDEEETTLKETLVNEPPELENDSVDFNETSNTVEVEEVSNDSFNEPDIKEPTKTESVLDIAQSLREQAGRARLEAEKMDLLLTMEKITKLEKQLLDKTASKDPKQREFLQSQIATLKRKLSGDANSQTGIITDGSITKPELQSVNVHTATLEEPDISDDIQDIVDSFQKAPAFMQKLVLKVGGYVNGETVNITTLAEKMIREDQKFQLQRRGQYKQQMMTSEKEGPSMTDASVVDSDFSQEQIDDIIDVLRIVPQFMKNAYPENIRNNDTAIALIMLKDEWREKGQRPDHNPTPDEIVRKIDQYKWLPTFVKGENETAFALEMIEAEQRKAFVQKGEMASNDEDEEGEVNEDEEAMNQTMIASFPNRMRKEGTGPTEVMIKTILTDVLAKEKIWTTSGRPEKVVGGYIIRGSTKFDKGDDLVDAIHKNLIAKSLDNSVRIFYIADPTPITKEEQLDEDRNPVLFVTGFDVSPEASSLFLSLVTAVGFGTLWYTAIYPCILNENIQKMVEEQLALADSSMGANFEWLDDMAVPIFFASLTIQGVHELAHRIFASANGLNITFPTLVPSLVTGITSSVTSLKTPARNKQALFDFSISGPLAGLVASTASIVFGLMVMQSMDPSLFPNLPALPIQSLRQSSLGGGIIDSFFPGILNIPSGSEASSTISSININLHPLVIAGFFGLQLNAVALLPIGKTDGGRISTVLFGRRAAQLVSALSLLAIFIQGLIGSDILLFYFSYVIFFESVPELPAENEVDDISFPRVLLAITSTMLLLLTLIPM